MLHGLADLLVVDLSRGIAGGYTTKLLTDAETQANSILAGVK